YAKGQVNLAAMYINGQHVEKDFEQALYWLKAASLQSHKPAILKYGIICRQVESCYLADFYQELTAAGVNIQVREMDFKLRN
ncbi:MAG: SEL1-like repeat protein, partial [Colwellia sp.]|nr:SEL1-like repeat protein [Colwellia sp.]